MELRRTCPISGLTIKSVPDLECLLSNVIDRTSPFHHKMALFHSGRSVYEVLIGPFVPRCPLTDV